MSQLRKRKAKLLLRKANLNDGIIAEALQLFGCFPVFESQVLCQLWKKIVKKRLVKLETSQLITRSAQKPCSAN